MPEKKEKMTKLDWLIVIVVLVVVSVATLPFYKMHMEQMGETTDLANERAARYLAWYLRDARAAEDYVRYYDAEAGMLVKEAPAAYGCGSDYGDIAQDNRGKFLRVEQADGEVLITWVEEIDETEESSETAAD